MARKKPPSEWTEAYRKRVERKLRENPFLTASEATGRKRKTPPPDADEETLSKFQIRKLRDNQELRRDLGLIDREAANQNIKALDALKKEITLIYEKFPPGTRAYYKHEEEAKRLYWDLAASGVLPAGKPEGVIYYH